MCSTLRHGTGGSCRRHRKTRGWRGLQHAVALGINAACGHMRMRHRIYRCQHRCEAGIAAFEQADPVLAWLSDEQGRHPLAQGTPAAGVVRILERLIVAKPEFSEKQGIELRLQRLHADEMAIRAAISAAPVRTVEKTATTFERLLTGSVRDRKSTRLNSSHT